MTRRPYMAAIVALIFLIAVACLLIARGDVLKFPAEQDSHPAPAEPAGTPAAVTKPYAVNVPLPDGRTAVCVFNNAGGLACEWPTAPVMPVAVVPGE